MYIIYNINNKSKKKKSENEKKWFIKKFLNQGVKLKQNKKFGKKYIKKLC